MAMASSTAISFSTTTTTASLSSSSSHFPSSSSSLCFRFSPYSNFISKLPSLSKDLYQTLSRSVVVKAQSKQVSVDGSSDAAAPGVQPSNSKEVKASTQPSSAASATSESISEFISQVASLVKLVDSRDIMELQLKQLDCELVIRKKEALPQPPPYAPPTIIHSPSPPVDPQTPMAPAPAPAAASPPAPSASASQPAAAASSLPALKCPMAGTFYRSPAPGEPPFVKKGDKVQKGQVVCVIEAMKLMNEIEADQSGTVVDILVEDGKPVSVDTPLLIIKP